MLGFVEYIETALLSMVPTPFSSLLKSFNCSELDFVKGTFLSSIIGGGRFVEVDGGMVSERGTELVVLIGGGILIDLFDSNSSIEGGGVSGLILLINSLSV